MEAVVRVGANALQRLVDLGIDKMWIYRALEAGEAEARAWTEAAPRAMPGMARWGRTNERFRIESGWKWENPKNLPIAISPTGEFAVFATTGDEWTGFRGSEQPTTKYAKGAATASAVERNEQLTIDELVKEEIGVEFSEIVASSEGVATWVLLYNVTVEGIYVELSLPDSISKKGYIETWRERIIIDRYDFQPVPENEDRWDDGDGGFEVAVQRR